MGQAGAGDPGTGQQQGTQQRAAEVVLGDQHYRAVIQADVVDGGAGNGAIRWRDRQGAGCEILPLGAAAAVAGIHHAALHGAIPLYPGRHDPHLLILLLREHRVKAR